MSTPAVTRAARALIAGFGLSAVVLALLSASASASASTREAYLAKAVSYWKEDRPVRWVWRDLRPTVYARTWIGPKASPHATADSFRPLRLLFDPDYWRTFSFAMRCTVYLHEYGHVIGQTHAGTRKGDLMYPFFTKPHKACRGWRP
jgi:hypothetical protein